MNLDMLYFTGAKQKLCFMKLSGDEGGKREVVCALANNFLLFGDIE